MTIEEKLYGSGIRILAPYMGFITTGCLVYLPLGESLWLDENLSSLKHFLFWLPIGFLLMGLFMRVAEKQQHDRIQERLQALEAALAARDENTTD